MKKENKIPLISEGRDKIKIIFIGTSEFAVPSFRALLRDKDFDIRAVISQPDKKVGRKQELTPPPIKTEANKHKISVQQPLKIHEARSKIQEVDLIVVISYGQIIPKNILDIPKFGAVNVHGSLLPKYRGAACIQAPILAGDKETGLTIIKMDENIDTVPILHQVKLSLGGDETSTSLHDKLAKLSAEVLSEVLKNYVAGIVKPIPQDESKSSYVSQLKKEDGRIDWQKSATEIERMVRAFNPWPGTFSELGIMNYESGKSIIKILEVKNEILEINKHKVGELFLDNGKLAVQCGQDALVIKKLQLAGKKPMSAEEFLRGHENFIGEVLK